MPFPPTPSNSPSNTPTPSVTPSISPSVTPTGTECPDITNTPSQTPTATPTLTATNTPTPSVTQTIDLTPTLTSTTTHTPTPTTTPTTPFCCYQYEVTNYYATSKTVYYTDCEGNPQSISCTGGGNQTYISCALENSVYTNDTVCDNSSTDCITWVRADTPCGGCI